MKKWSMIYATKDNKWGWSVPGSYGSFGICRWIWQARILIALNGGGFNPHLFQ